MSLSFCVSVCLCMRKKKRRATPFTPCSLLLSSSLLSPPLFARRQASTRGIVHYLLHHLQTQTQTYTHAHKGTHTEGERDRERQRDRRACVFYKRLRQKEREGVGASPQTRFHLRPVRWSIHEVFPFSFPHCCGIGDVQHYRHVGGAEQPGPFCSCAS